MLYDAIVCYRGTNIENKGKVQSEYDNLDVSLEAIEMKLHAESIDISKVRSMFSITAPSKFTLISPCVGLRGMRHGGATSSGCGGNRTYQ